MTALRKIDRCPEQALLIGFWLVERFSKTGITNKTLANTRIDKIPINLSDKIRNKLNVPNRYQSGRISKGVAKGLAAGLIFKGSNIANPRRQDLIPKITMGNMYKISFGHPASP